LAAAFRKGLAETGYIDGQNVMVEYHWLDGQYDLLPTLMADLVRRRVAVIAASGTTVLVLAAKRPTKGAKLNPAEHWAGAAKIASASRPWHDRKRIG
jgi:hypothetical protein